MKKVLLLASAVLISAASALLPPEDVPVEQIAPPARTAGIASTALSKAAAVACASLKNIEKRKEKGKGAFSCGLARVDAISCGHWATRRKSEMNDRE